MTAKWLIPAAGLILAASAAAAGVGVWAPTGGDSAAACDHEAMRQAMAEGIRHADGRGLREYMLDAGGCSDAEMTSLMQGMSREWHMMPGGMMMRSPAHATP